MQRPNHSTGRPRARHPAALTMRLRRAGRLARDIAYYADTTQVRFLMAWASVWWGGVLILDPAILQRPIHELMVLMVQVLVVWVDQWLPWLQLGHWLTPSVAWGVSFLVYGFAALWRIFEGRPRVTMGILVNFLGFALWFGSTLAMSLSLGRLSLAMTLEWILSAQLLIVAVRTSLNDDMTSP